MARCSARNSQWIEGNGDQTVRPSCSGLSISRQRNDAPLSPSDSIPRCFPYHCRSPSGSFALKKIPPMPVTFFIESSFDLRPHVVERSQSVLPRHLFPPLRDEVGVV